MPKATRLISTYKIILLSIINDIHLCDDSDHGSAVLRTGLQETNVVLTGDLISVGNILGTTNLDQ